MTVAGATGIIWVGPVFDPGGYGSVARNCLLGLRKIGFPVRVVNCGSDRRGSLPEDLVRWLLEARSAEVGGRPVAILHLPPDYYPRIRCKGVSRKIGYTIFETDRIPGDWPSLCEGVDEVWVPSEFNLETFSASGVERSRLRVLPYGVDTDYYRPVGETLQLEGKKKFSFLYVFAFDWRKGFDLLLEAYYREFSASDNVTLVLKVFRPDYYKGEGDLKSIILGSAPAGRPDPPHVLIIDEHLSTDDMRKLYNSCDVYVSTDRANGWGMPCMEAMAMGKPAATIDWSGSTQFMKEGNSLLIRPTGNLVPVDDRLVSHRPFYRGHRWAEVKVEEVRRVLRSAYEDREALARVAERGRGDVASDFSLEAIARKTVELVSDVPEAPQGKASCFVKYSAKEKLYLLKLNLQRVLAK